MTLTSNLSEDMMSSIEPPARRRRWTSMVASLTAVAGIGAALASFMPVGTTSAATTEAGVNGIVCTVDRDHGASPHFDITAVGGEITMPDGNAIYTWSYAVTDATLIKPQTFQFPGPIMCVNEGDVVTIKLHNSLPIATSIQFPGLDGVTLGDGTTPVEPQFTTATGDLVSLSQETGVGNDVTYQFTATKAGTYLYQSGTDPELQVQMGLFGSIVVRPVGATIVNVPTSFLADAACAYHDPSISTRCDEAAVYNRKNENILMLSEVDPALHQFVQQNLGTTGKLKSSAYTAAFTPHYYLINGRSFPDTIAPNNAPWLPAQPYGALASVQPYDKSANPLDALLRYVGVGAESYPFHPHSNHERVIAEDARLMKAVNGARTDDLTEEKFAIMVSPGATVDATFRWTNEERYKDASGRRLPVAIPQAANLTEGDLWSGSPYLGDSNPLNPGINGKTQCGEYYHVAHSHNLSQATNYGASFGGMLTLIRVEPPTPNNCSN